MARATSPALKRLRHLLRRLSILAVAAIWSSNKSAGTISSPTNPYISHQNLERPATRQGVVVFLTPQLILRRLVKYQESSRTMIPSGEGVRSLELTKFHEIMKFPLTFLLVAKPLTARLLIPLRGRDLYGGAQSLLQHSYCATFSFF